MEKEVRDVIVKDNENSMMTNALSIDAVAEQVKAVHELMKKLMRPEEHYGIIPGTKKPTLLKPGAEKICMMFQLRPEYKITRVNLPDNHTEYEITCEIFSKKTGLSWGQGVGSCSTLESKFRYRYDPAVCPECGKNTIIRGKREYGGGWLCWAKKGGCGSKWDDTHNFDSIKVENPDIADVYNTVLKIAKKRALLDAVITATAASDIFTQDMDELSKTFNQQEPEQQNKNHLLEIPEDIIIPCKQILEWNDKKVYDFWLFCKKEFQTAKVNTVFNIFKENIGDTKLSNDFYYSVFNLCTKENWSQDSIDEANRMIVDMKPEKKGAKK